MAKTQLKKRNKAPSADKAAKAGKLPQTDKRVKKKQVFKRSARSQSGSKVAGVTFDVGPSSKADDERDAKSEEVKSDSDVNKSVEAAAVGSEEQLAADVSCADVSLDPYRLEDRSRCMEALADEKWTNKQRVLVLCARGVTHRHRHLMEDIKMMLPHSKSEPKWEKSASLSEINEICEMQSCNSCLYFETRKSTELYLWLARAPDGPSIKFQVLNCHTLGELKMTGNCLLHSRPLILFDKSFGESADLRLMRELLIQTFGTPRNHPKSKPFFDHVMSFFFYDKKIWFRHYQITPMTDKDANCPERQLFTEIGPRFVLDPIKIFDGSFGGRTIYENPTYMTPTAIRLMAARGLGSKYAARVAAKHQRKLRLAGMRRGQDPLAPQQIFLPTSSQ